MAARWETSYICLARHKVFIKSLSASLAHLGCSNQTLMHPFVLEPFPSRQCCPVCRSLSKAQQAATLVILQPFVLTEHVQEAAGKCCIDQLRISCLKNRNPRHLMEKIGTLCSRCTAKVQREQRGPEPSGAMLSGQLCRPGYSQTNLLAN